VGGKGFKYLICSCSLSGPPLLRILHLQGLGSFHLVTFSPPLFVECFVLLMIGRFSLYIYIYIYFNFVRYPCGLVTTPTRGLSQIWLHDVREVTK